MTPKISPPTVWHSRKEALAGAIEDVRNAIGDPDVKGNRHSEEQPSTFRLDASTQIIGYQLTKNLYEFVEKHYDYFLSLYDQERSKPGSAMPPKGMLHENAMSSILRQASIDLSLIIQAVSQRAQSTESTTNFIRTGLSLSDYLAQSTMNAAYRFFGDAEQPVAFTYLFKVPTIKVIPYLQVALIGIPYTSPGTNGIGAYRDLLSIPHEIGHYLYWNGKMPISNRSIYFELRRRIPADTPGWMLKWVEEIFADVFGAVIAGAVIALDFQDLQLHNAPYEDFFADDGEHPSPILRPEIYLYVLEKSGKGALADRLRMRWQLELQSSKRNNVLPTLRPHELSEIPLHKSATTLIHALVDVIWDMLREHNALGVDPLDIWSASDKTIQNVIDGSENTESLEVDWETRLKAGSYPTTCPGHGNKDILSDLKTFNWDYARILAISEAKTELPRTPEMTASDIEWHATLQVGGWSDDVVGPPKRGNP